MPTVATGSLVSPGGAQGPSGPSGPSGPTAVSADAGNIATLGSDSKIFVSAVLPAGVIMPYAGTASPPAGWLNCNGVAVSRTTYANLFAAISTLFGAGDGSTTFNVPDLQGRVPVGSGSGTGLTTRSVAATGGEEAHKLVAAEMPSHTHTYLWTSGVGTVLASGNYTTNSASGTTGSAGSDGSHNTMQPFLVLTYIIKT